eukprot:491282-Pleurochrysis_carterae.AAC.1
MVTMLMARARAVERCVGGASLAKLADVEADARRSERMRWPRHEKERQREQPRRWPRALQTAPGALQRRLQAAASRIGRAVRGDAWFEEGNHVRRYLKARRLHAEACAERVEVRREPASVRHAVSGTEDMANVEARLGVTKRRQGMQVFERSLGCVMSGF